MNWQGLLIVLLPFWAFGFGYWHATWQPRKAEIGSIPWGVALLFVILLVVWPLSWVFGWFSMFVAYLNAWKLQDIAELKKELARRENRIA